MASYFKLLSERNRPVESIFAQTDIAEENRGAEAIAATKIQGVARMSQNRRRYLYVRQCVIDMQRVYRGYRGRLVSLDRANVEAERRQLAICSHYAAIIQARFRGYLSRKWVSDFYAQKKYVMLVTEKSEAVRKETEDTYNKQREYTERQTADVLYDDFCKAMSNKHHLLSTATISGVYRPPLSERGMGTVFGSNIEDDLRAIPIPRRKFKKDLPSKTTSMKKSIVDNDAGQTLVASSKYDAVLEQSRLDKSVNERVVASLHGRKFASRKIKDTKVDITLNADEPYCPTVSNRSTRR